MIHNHRQHRGIMILLSTCNYNTDAVQDLTPYTTQRSDSQTIYGRP